MSLKKNFPEALRLLRHRAGITPAELSKRSGLTRSVIGNYETGVGLPTIQSLEKVLHALGANRFDLANALREVAGQPPLEFYRLEDWEDPRQEFLRLLDLNVGPELAEVFLAGLAALCQRFTGQVPDSLLQPEGTRLPPKQEITAPN